MLEWGLRDINLNHIIYLSGFEAQLVTLSPKPYLKFSSMKLTRKKFVVKLKVFNFYKRKQNFVTYLGEL